MIEFLAIFAVFHGNIRKFLKLLQMEQYSFYLIEQASEMSKITLSIIVYAPCQSIFIRHKIMTAHTNN